MEVNKEINKIDCYKCKTKIAERQIYRLQNHPFHIKCFVCNRCNEKLDVNSCFLDEMMERVSCEMCYHDMMDRCTKCEEEIIGQIIQVEGNRRFHKECFTCAKCNRQLCEYGDVDGKLYCPADYHQMIGPKCFKCNQTILPDKTSTIQTFKFKENNFHSKCFVCDKCNCSLDDPETGRKLFFTIQEQKLCKPCALAAKKALLLMKKQQQQAS